MAHIEIEWLSDEHDCETCGWAFASGARVRQDGELLLELIPFASCFGSDHWDQAEVYDAIFRELGHTVELRETD